MATGRPVCRAACHKTLGCQAEAERGHVGWRPIQDAASGPPYAAMFLHHGSIGDPHDWEMIAYGSVAPISSP